MAAPPNKTLKDLNGKWNMNKTLSDSPEPGLTLQGIGYLTRKAIGLASVSVTIKEYEGPAKEPAGPSPAGPYTHIDSEQTASGLSGTKEARCLDDFSREHSDWLFGTIDSRTRWARLAEVESEYLKTGWLAADDDMFIFSVAVSKANGWTATQVWGFQDVNGERRHCRKVVISKGAKKAEFRLVYDFVG